MIEAQTTNDDMKDEGQSGIWMRGLVMIAFAIFFAMAQSLLGAMAVVQFLWVVITKEKNVAIADFGASLGEWIGQVVRFQTFATEERPFPWAHWPKGE